MIYRTTLALCVFAAAVAAQTQRQIHAIEMNGREISYTIDGPYAVTQGDIIIGNATEVEGWRIARERGQAQGAAEFAPRSLHQIFGASGASLWPNGIIYYAIDPAITNQQPILDGIAQWNSLTPLQVLPRTGQANYVLFQTVSIDAACESFIGQVGGSQVIGYTAGCDAGSVAHELGHAFGLWHEHQRLDRGGNVTVLYGNIDKRFYSDFYQFPASSASAGYYDFGSLMHYPWYGFSTSFQDTLESVPVGIPIGQRDTLSAGDIDGASRLYGITPSATTITTVPTGLAITVDGVAAVSPQSYDWAAGTQHTVSVDAAQGADPRYVFANWSDGGDATHALTASADVTAFCANFIVEHVVVVSGGGRTGNSAALSPSPAGGYLPERYPFKIAATPAPGQQFLDWGGLGYLLPFYGTSMSAPSVFFEVSQSPYQEYSATFTSAPLTTIDSQPRGLQITVDGGTAVTPASFAWTAGTAHTLSVFNPQYSGNNTARAQFLNWEDGSMGTRTVTAASNGGTYTGFFDTQYLLSTGVIGAGSVSVSPPSADGFYDAGTTIQLTASPGAGAVLRYWVGDLASNQNPASIVMDQQRAVTANLEPALAFRVLSAASFTGNPNIGSAGTAVAPGELVAIFGAGIGPENATPAGLDASGNFPLSLAGYQVSFDGFSAPIIYAGPDQINAVVPYAVAGQAGTQVIITGPSGSSKSSMDVNPTAPSLFTFDGSGTGALAALNQDGSLNTPDNPAAKGSTIVLFGTGAGLLDKQFPDGQVTGLDLGHVSAPVWVRFGKLPAVVQYAGSAPYEVNGVVQINAVLPGDLVETGQVPVQVIIGSYATPPGTTISVQ